MTGELIKPACSIVIRAYNEEKTIARLLDGIAQQSIQQVEIIVVDSGSTDNTIGVARGHGARVVRIPPSQFTFGRSLNMGIAQSEGDFIIIASAHVYPVFPDWLEHLLAAFHNERVALVYGKQRGNDFSYFSERQLLHRWFPDRSNPAQSHPFCNNANAAIRKSLWHTHPFDETLSGLEDIAWARWAIENNHLLAYTAEAEVIHVHRETPAAVGKRYFREAMAFKRIYPLEKFNLLDFLRLSTTNICSDIWHAIKDKKLLASFTSIIWFRWMQFWGTYQGYRQSGPLTWQLRQTLYYPNHITSSTSARSRDVEPIRYNDG